MIERGVLAARSAAVSVRLPARGGARGPASVSQIGIVGCCHVDDYNEERIKKHEVTRKDKEDDRTRHTLAINANAGPVFLAYKPRRRRWPRSPQSATRTRRALRLHRRGRRAPHGLAHRGRRSRSSTRSRASTAPTWPTATTAARRPRAPPSSSAARTRTTRGDEEYNWFLCVLFAADQLNVLPYHRLVRDLGGLTPAAPARAAARDRDGRRRPTRRSRTQPGRVRHVPRRAAGTSVALPAGARASERPGALARLRAAQRARARADPRHHRPADRQAHRLRGRHPRHRASSSAG